MTVSDSDILTRATRLPCWHKARDPVFLGGGKTNQNILITDQGQQYVVRFGQDIPEHGILRWNELAVSKAAHAAGVAPGVHYFAPGVMVLDYIAATPVTPADFQSDATIDALAQLLRRVHHDAFQRLEGPVLSFWVFHILRSYGQFLTSHASGYLTLLPELLVQARDLEARVGPVEIVLAHNDLLPGNILRNGERFWLIDWEYAGLGSPLFDLGGLATNNTLTVRQETRLLEAYFQAPIDGALLARYGAMKCASLLRETMWSMVSELSSPIDFDFPSYTATNLAAYRASWSDLKSL